MAGLIFALTRTLFWLFVILVALSFYYYIKNKSAQDLKNKRMAMELFCHFGLPCLLLSFVIGILCPSWLTTICYLPFGFGLHGLLFWIVQKRQSMNKTNP